MFTKQQATSDSAVMGKDKKKKGKGAAKTAMKTEKKEVKKLKKELLAKGEVRSSRKFHNFIYF